MKGLGRILGRYVGAAIGVGVFLLALNIAVFLAFLLYCSRDMPVVEDRVSVIAAGIEQQADGSFSVSEEARKALDERYAWAMQLDDAGNVIWSDRVPENLPQHYTASEIASFSRWYLEDYPVYVWSDGDGLLVLASAAGSEWKYVMRVSTYMIEQMQIWIPAVLMLNLLAALALALLLGWRMYRAAAPLAEGISGLARGEGAKLSERGVLGLLSADVNRASEKLLAQRTLLHKRDRTRTEWIAGVSHDIRTPLSIVQGNAAQLENDRTLPGQARDKAAAIREQSQRIGNLVSDLNLASKLEYELQPLHIAVFRPAAMLRTAAADVLNSMADARVSLAVSIPPEAGALTVSGDEALLRRAVDNLLRNSILHNAGKSVEVGLTLAADARSWTVTVTDNGGGLSDEVLDRLRRPREEALPVHGLGLVLVQQIAYAHGGSVWFENTRPGLRVALRFPRQDG